MSAIFAGQRPPLSAQEVERARDVDAQGRDREENDVPEGSSHKAQALLGARAERVYHVRIRSDVPNLRSTSNQQVLQVQEVFSLDVLWH